MFHHNDENALVCDLCGKKFNRKTRLTEHISYIHLKVCLQTFDSLDTDTANLFHRKKCQNVTCVKRRS